MSEAEGQLRCSRAANLMEVCGTHSHAIARHGIRQLLPDGVRMLSGPGCPVCVTPMSVIDLAIEIARQPDTIMTTFGDMMRVPGSRSSLSDERARGHYIKVVYSPTQAVELAAEREESEVVFMGVGFETTAPMVASAILQADAEGAENFSVIVAHKLIPPAMRALMDDEDVRIDGFLCPGHVATVIGARPFYEIAKEHSVPCVVAGFEAKDIILGLKALLSQIDDGRHEGENEYGRCVSEEGNVSAQRAMQRVFEPTDTEWRGLGRMPASGLTLRSEYARFDAEERFDVELGPVREHPGCACGDVLRGVVAPDECPLFAEVCTPDSPVGPCMVSSEGACAAAYRYGT